MSHEIAVSCRPVEGGWMCQVRVGSDEAATEHAVQVGHEDAASLAPPGTTPEELVRESFRFMLEREPRESILRSFELPIIGRYFAEYTTELPRRLEAPRP